jgi:hypothetical protein
MLVCSFQPTSPNIFMDRPNGNFCPLIFWRFIRTGGYFVMGLDVGTFQILFEIHYPEYDSVDNMARNSAPLQCRWVMKDSRTSTQFQQTREKKIWREFCIYIKSTEKENLKASKLGVSA